MSVKMATEESFKYMVRQMGKLRDQMQKGYYNYCPSETWMPNVNLYETDSSYLVCVDLAGVDHTKIDLLVQNQQLVLKGTRAVPTYQSLEDAGKKPRVHLMEIDHGAFVREIELPHNVRTEQIQAHYREGLLWVELPKT